MRNTLLFFFCFILHTNTAYSEVYKWIDENGKTVYGDKPVSENANVIKIRKKPSTDKAYLERREKQQKLLDVMQDERNEKITSKKEEKEKKEKQKLQCAKLKKELKEARNASALYEDTDDPDNPRFFSDEERKAEEKKYEMYIKENC
jgi:hypothetical protein